MPSTKSETPPTIGIIGDQEIDMVLLRCFCSQGCLALEANRKMACTDPLQRKAGKGPAAVQ